MEMTSIDAEGRKTVRSNANGTRNANETVGDRGSTLTIETVIGSANVIAVIGEDAEQETTKKTMSITMARNLPLRRGAGGTSTMMKSETREVEAEILNGIEMIAELGEGREVRRLTTMMYLLLAENESEMIDAQGEVTMTMMTIGLAADIPQLTMNTIDELHLLVVEMPSPLLQVFRKNNARCAQSSSIRSRLASQIAN